MRIHWSVLIAVLAAAPAAEKKSRGDLSPLEEYVSQARRRQAADNEGRPGSLWRPGAALGDLARDLKASQVDDLVTILVSDRASAIAKGTTKSSRKAGAQHSVGALFGATQAAGRLANLSNLSGSSDLDGQGATTRDTVLTTTLTARVVEVLPNGYLVVEGSKETVVNSERQWITIRGVVRPYDIAPGNVVRSDRLAQLEVRINGRGVVGDAVRRPFFLYRLLMGLLPF